MNKLIEQRETLDNINMINYLTSLILLLMIPSSILADSTENIEQAIQQEVIKAVSDHILSGVGGVSGDQKKRSIRSNSEVMKQMNPLEGRSNFKLNDSELERRAIDVYEDKKRRESGQSASIMDDVKHYYYKIKFWIKNKFNSLFGRWLPKETEYEKRKKADAIDVF